MTSKHFLGLDVRRHPWLAGQFWAALVCPAFIVIKLLEGYRFTFESTAVLMGLCALGGVAFGAGMSILAVATGRDG